MRLNFQKWGKWRIFGVSIVAALVITPFMASFYFSVFQSYGGGLLGFPDEFETYPLTFMLIYTLLLPIFYIGFSRSPHVVTVIYFLVLPFFLFTAAGANRLLYGSILLVIGVLFGFGTRQLTKKR